jgi:hypothetical protein
MASLLELQTHRFDPVIAYVESQGLRLASVTDDGSRPSAYDHRGLQKMPDPRRPWRSLEWLRMIDSYHACQDGQQRGEVICGPRTESQYWAKRMRAP